MTSHLPLVTLLSANVVSRIGSVLTLVAVPWFVLQTTGSAAQTGITGAVQVAAFVLAGLLGGTVVDRVGFKRASVLGDMISGFLIAQIPFWYQTVGLEFWQLLVLVFLAVLFDAPGTTARESLLPSVAHWSAMPVERINSAYHAIPRTAQLLGPPLAGILIAVIGASNVLWVDAATFGISALIISLGIPQSETGTASQSESTLHGYIADIVEGLRFLRRDRLLSAMTINNAYGNFVGASVGTVILPVYAQQVFGSAVELGWMLSTYGGAALAGALLFGVISDRISRRIIYVTGWVTLVAPLLILATTPSLPVTLAALALFGIGSGPQLPLTFTIAQERVPAELRGRFFGARAALAEGITPLGMLIAGYLIESTRLSTTLAIAGITTLPVALNVVFNPVFRQMKPPARHDSSSEPVIVSGR